MRIDIASFSPLRALKAPPGVKYCQIIIKGAAIGEQDSGPMQTVTDLILVDGTDTGSISLSLKVDTAPGSVLVMAAGVLFYEDYEGLPSAIRGGALAVVGVQRVPASETASGTTTRRDVKLAKDMGRTAGAVTLAKLKKLVSPATSTGGTALIPDYEQKKIKLRKRLWQQKLNKYRYG